MAETDRLEGWTVLFKTSPDGIRQYTYDRLGQPRVYRTLSSFKQGAFREDIYFPRSEDQNVMTDSQLIDNLRATYSILFGSSFLEGVHQVRFMHGFQGEPQIHLWRPVIDGGIIFPAHTLNGHSHIEIDRSSS